MFVCLLGSVIFPFKNSVYLSLRGLVRYGRVGWRHRQTGRRKGGGTAVQLRSVVGFSKMADYNQFPSIRGLPRSCVEGCGIGIVKVEFWSITTVRREKMAFSDCPKGALVRLAQRGRIKGEGSFVFSL
ncbi:hypothetical protein V6N13_125652 [Hibiscus sabdariffa]